LTGRTSLVTAAAIVGVLLAGTAAVAANIGILNAADSSAIGDLAATGELLPAAGAAPAAPAAMVEVPAATSTTVSSMPSASGAQQYDIQNTGAVWVLATRSGIALDHVVAEPGWISTLSQSDVRSLRVDFTNGDRTVVFNAALADDGTVAVDVTEPTTVVAGSAASTGAQSTAGATPTASYSDDDHSDEHSDDDDDHSDGDHEGADDDDLRRPTPHSPTAPSSAYGFRSADTCCCFRVSIISNRGAIVTTSTTSPHGAAGANRDRGHRALDHAGSGCIDGDRKCRRPRGSIHPHTRRHAAGRHAPDHDIADTTTDISADTTGASCRRRHDTDQHRADSDDAHRAARRAGSRSTHSPRSSPRSRGDHSWQQLNTAVA
jgi:hypothetical protein